MYNFVFWAFLKRLPAEFAHYLSFWALRVLTAVPGVSALMRRKFGPKGPVIHALGLRFPGPLGLAAGFDKNATAPEALAALGFSFIEVGTVTALPQPGNDKPRLFRLSDDRALINRMGFNNNGAQAAAERLREKPRRVIVGVNIGKSKVVSEADAIEDYRASARAVAEVADYVVVNVSSPNTPGLRNLQAVQTLGPLLQAVRQTLDESALNRVPLLVKIAPDLADDDIDAVADLACALELDGIIATNTTISREGLSAAADDVAALGAGGLSGKPLKARSLEVLKRLKARLSTHAAGADVVLIAAGGIENAQDAAERLRAGATLIQAYTGLIYGGPWWPSRLQKELTLMDTQYRATDG
ncbi:MAG: quinone-dependent dihydroorotate dehydrogenase [Corynebacteriales bacterium]|nr:quinone-dependent dihydroorotate dehydrogenase [Mycobacteriales bacterium]